MISSPKMSKTLEITPDRVAELMPGSPILSSVDLDTRGVVLQRFHLPSSRISLPTIRDNLLVIHLQGHVFVTEELDGGHLQRRWSERDQISITPAGESVTRLLKGRPDVLLLHIPARLVREVGSEVWDVDPDKVNLLQCLAEPDEQVSRIGRALQAEIHSPSQGTGLMADLLCRAMALGLLRRHSSLGTRPLPQSAQLARGRLNRVLQYMREHLDEQLSLRELAVLSGLSQTHFARSFRNNIGRSPHRYLIELRIDRARGLLERTSITIPEIGVMCGFGQANHFSSMFRKFTGLSPRAYRVEFRK